jgi:hypothetical protein
MVQRLLRITGGGFMRHTNQREEQMMLRLAGAALVAASTGCARLTGATATSGNAVLAAATAPATGAAPTTAPALVDYADKGVHFQYRDNWKPKKDDDYELHLVPADGAGKRDVTFDIPDLPPHFEWMIQLSRIESGYVDDLKKKHPGLHVDSSADQSVNGGGKARLVQSSWKVDGTTFNDVGLLIMRKGQVCLLTCDADAADLAATRSDFDKIAGSLRWDK